LTDNAPTAAGSVPPSRSAAAQPVAHEDTGGLTSSRLVWDLPLRLFHWLFALSIVASYVTAKLGFDWMQYHFYLGYFMIGLLIFRVVWGFIGPRHARFSSFLARPSVAWSYAQHLFDRNSTPSVGHNPIGGLMVIFMLLLLVVQVSTGLFATDAVIWTGPYYPSVKQSTASLLSTIHSVNVNIILGAVGLHILAIIYYHTFKKQSLVPSMFSGYKPATLVPADHAIQSSQLFKAVIVCAIAACLVYALLANAPPPADNSF
jgi:cytochrome b